MESSSSPEGPKRFTYELAGGLVVHTTDERKPKPAPEPENQIIVPTTKERSLRNGF